jgi:hypothetical protein
MTRTDIINRIAAKIGAESYLEIGVRDGENFKMINCDYKLGVDPDPNSKALILQTSDFFFAFNKAKFDLVLVDGMHTEKQVARDIQNSIKILNDGGWIICHDMNPTEELQQTEQYYGGAWSGTCWRAFVELRRTRSDLYMAVVDTDYGCGIITRGKQELLKVDEPLTYQLLERRRRELLNLISVQEFEKLMSEYI